MDNIASTGHRIAVLEVVLSDVANGADLARLRTTIDEALALRPRRLIVDVSACRTMDASAISVLVYAHRVMRRAAGSFSVRGVTAGLRRNLQLTRADLVLDVVADHDPPPRAGNPPTLPDRP